MIIDIKANIELDDSEQWSVPVQKTFTGDALAEEYEHRKVVSIDWHYPENKVTLYTKQALKVNGESNIGLKPIEVPVTELPVNIQAMFTSTQMYFTR
jgi:hypothetical protein